MSPDVHGCYAENAICCKGNGMTTVKGFQGRSRSIANIVYAVLGAQVCATGRDCLDSAALLLSVSLYPDMQQPASAIPAVLGKSNRELWPRF